MESFVLANFQGNTEYDAGYVSSGLHVWHVLRRPVDSTEISWDLESAVGKFPNPESGKDSLEAVFSYLGSGNDVFRAAGNATLACGTNPSTRLYSGASYTSAQSVKSSVAFERIRESGGNVLLDVFVTPEQALTFPTAGDTADVDMANSLSWDVRSQACIDTVIGLYSLNAGASFDTLFVGASNSGTFSWTPTVIDSDYVVRLISHDDAGGTGISESGVFRVMDRTAPSTTSDLFVEFIAQTSVILTWTAPGDDG